MMKYINKIVHAFQKYIIDYLFHACISIVCFRYDSVRMFYLYIFIRCLMFVCLNKVSILLMIFHTASKKHRIQEVSKFCL